MVPINQTNQSKTYKSITYLFLQATTSRKSQTILQRI